MNPTTVQYCQSCGKPLNAQARFCGRCGKSVPQLSSPLTQLPQPAQSPNMQPSRPASQPAAEQPVAQPKPTEFIVTALPVGNQRSGFLGVRAKGYILVLTNLRILLAEQTSEIMKESARQAKEAAKQNGKGFFGQWGAVMGSSGSQRYLQMHPQSILNETTGNYFIANNQVRAVRIKENYDPENGRSEVKLTLDTVNSKVELIYTQTNKKEIKQALQQTLGNLVR